MSSRSLRIAMVLAVVAVIAGCASETDPDQPVTTQVQLLNATNYSYELRAGGQVAGAAVTAFGASSGCTKVDLNSPNITVTPAGSAVPMDAISALGGSAQSYAIVAYPTSTGMGLSY